MTVEKAISYDTTSDSEEREEFRRGGRGGGGGRGGRGGGASSGGGRGGKSSGGGRRGGGSRGRGKGSSKGSTGGQGQSRGGPGKGRASSSAGKSKGRSSARGASTKGAQSRSAARSAASSREAGRTASTRAAAAASKSKSSARAASAAAAKSRAAAAAKSKAAASSRPSMKDIGVTKSFKSPTKQKVSTLDKKKMRSPEMFSPQDVAAAIGRKSLADVKAGKFKSRNAAYKANQAAVDAQKARFDGYSPSEGSDTSAIAGYGGINAKNLGLGVQAAYNKAQARNETTGMGIGDSLRFQATRPEFKNDIDNLKSIAGSIPTPMNIARKIAMGLLNPDGTAIAQAPEQTGGIMGSLKNMIANRPDMDLEAQRQAQQRDGGRGYETPPPIMAPPMVAPPPATTPGGGLLEKLPDGIQIQPAIPSYMKLAGYGDDEARQLMSMYNPGSTFSI